MTAFGERVELVFVLVPMLEGLRLGMVDDCCVWGRISSSKVHVPLVALCCRRGV